MSRKLINIIYGEIYKLNYNIELNDCIIFIRMKKICFTIIYILISFSPFVSIHFILSVILNPILYAIWSKYTQVTFHSRAPGGISKNKIDPVFDSKKLGKERRIREED